MALGSRLRLRIFRRPPGATPTPTPTPGVPAATQMQSSATERGATIYFQDPVPVGQMASGENFFVGDYVITSTTPPSQVVDRTFSNGEAYTGRTVHGMMINPGRDGGTGAGTLYYQGFDTVKWASSVGKPTEYDYDLSVNKDPGVNGGAFLNGIGNTYAKSISIVENIDRLGRERLQTLVLFHSLPSVPLVNSFSRWAGMNDKMPIFTADEIDWTALPVLGRPANAVRPGVEEVLNKLGPLQFFFNQMLFTRGINATSQQSQYGGDIAKNIVDAMIYTMTSDVPEADRKRVAIKLVQAGLHLLDATVYGRRWSSPSFSYGGAMQWLKILLVYTAKLMRNAGNASMINQLMNFIDTSKNSIFADDQMIVPINRIRIEALPGDDLTTRIWPTGFFDWMEGIYDWNSKPSNLEGYMFSYDQAYRAINGCPLMGVAMITRILGMESSWNGAKFFNYIDRFYLTWRQLRASELIYLGSYAREFILAYYEQYALDFQGSTIATTTSSGARNDSAWVQISETFDLRFQPSVNSVAVSVDGVGVTFSNVVTTGSAVKSTDDPNPNTDTTYIAKPTITVASTTGVKPGMRVGGGTLPGDTYVIEVLSSTVVRISNVIKTAFSNQAITFYPISVFGNVLAAVLPTTLTPGQTLTFDYVPDASPARTLRGITVPAMSIGNMTNRTGELRASYAGSPEWSYGGTDATTRQVRAMSKFQPESVKRLLFAQEGVFKTAPAAANTIFGPATASSSTCRLYAPTIDDLRLSFASGGQSYTIRFPGALKATSGGLFEKIPVGTPFKLWFALDLTAGSYASMARLVVHGANNEVWSYTGTYGSSNAPLDNSASLEMTNQFSTGVYIGGNINANITDAAWGATLMGWGDGNKPMPVDLTAPAFTFNADWGPNGELPCGQQQRFFIDNLEGWNGSSPNRGFGLAATMAPKRVLDAETGELTRLFELYTPPSAALPETTAALARSVDFGHHNGLGAQQRALTGMNLTNLFGTGTTGGDVPGAIVCRAAIDKGWLSPSAGMSTSISLSAFSSMMGVGGTTSSFNVSYYGSDHATTANRNRVVVNLRDTGGTTTLNLKSAEWLDDDPRTVAIRFDGTNFSVDLVRLDGTLDAGAPVSKGTWKGLANGSNVAIGSYNGAAASGNNYWQGQISDVCSIRGRVLSDVELIAIGKGQTPTAVVPAANVARYFALRGPGDLTQTSGVDSSITLGTLAVGTDQALREGAPLSGAYDGTQGLSLKWLIEGYTAGLPYGNPNGSRPLPATVINTGTVATHVQARAVVIGTGVVHKGWTRITSVPLAPGASIAAALPGVTVSPPWLRLEVRREDNVQIRTGGRQCAVGQKIWAPDGQSQQAISCFTLTTSDTTSLDANIPGNASNVSFIGGPCLAGKRKPMRSGILRGRTELSIMMMNVAKRLSTMHPDRVFCFMLSPLAGTGRAEYYQNKVWHSAPGTNYGNGNRPDLYPTGTEPYYVWGDDVTPGSGMVTDLMLAGGRDISFFMTMPSVDDTFTIKNSQRMNCLFFGSDMAGTSVGGSYEDAAPTGAPPRYFARPETGLINPIHVAMQYHDRYIVKGTRTLDQVRSSTAAYRGLRALNRTWALGIGNGASGSVSHYIPDKMMETLSDGAHQSYEDPRGNLRMAGPFMMGMLKTAGLSNYDPEVFPTTAVLNASKDAIVVTIGLKNGGQLVTRDGRNPYGFEVSTNGGTNWTIVENTAVSITGTGQVTLTGNWSAFNASVLKVRYLGYDPSNVAAPSGDTADIFTEETDRLNGFLFESRSDVVTAPGVAVLNVMTADAALQVTQG